MNNKGVTLIILIFVIMVLATLGWTLSNIQSGSSQTNLNLYSSEKALYSAEAGVQWAISQLYQSLNWRTDNAHGYASGYAQHTLNPGGEYRIVCRNPQGLETGNAVIISTGYSPSQAQYYGMRIVKLMFAVDSALQFGVFGLQSVSLSGQAKTDGYNSDNGTYGAATRIYEGDVGTNGDITLSGQAFIGGDAITGLSGTFNYTNAVYGNITRAPDRTLSPIAVPDVLNNLVSLGSFSLSGQQNSSLGAGDYKFSSISLSGQSKLTITGPANIYLTGSSSLSISGQANMIISPASTGPVKIYADGNLSISGQGISNQTNNPEKFIIFGTSATTRTVSISGQGNLYGNVYAPTANLSISGQGNLYGAFVGNSVSLSGQAFIHYDIALKDSNICAIEPEVYSWQEQ